MLADRTTSTDCPPDDACEAQRSSAADRLNARLVRMSAEPWRWLALLALVLAVQISPWWHPTPDARSYLSMARSFAAGEGMTNLGREQLFYSPGYSFLITPAFVFGDRPFLALALLNWCLAVTAMLGVYIWARREMPTAALLVTAFVFVNVLVWVHYRRTLTEIAFLCALVWTVNAMSWSMRATSLGSALTRIIPAAALLAATSLLRQAGIMLAAGFGAALLLEVFARRISWLRAALLLVTVSTPAVLGVAWVVQRDVHSSAGEETYLDGFVVADQTLAQQLLDCARMRISDVGRVVVPGMSKCYGRDHEWWNVNVAIYVVVAALVGWGWWRFVRDRHDVLALAAPFYMALYLTWPFETGGRFLVPLTPLLAACLWFVVEPLARHRLNILAWLVGLHLVAAVGYWVFVDLPRSIEHHRQWAAIDDLVSAIGPERDSVVAVGLPIETRLMLELALDRPVKERTSTSHFDLDVEWLVQSTDEPNVEGFALRRAADHLALLSRTSHLEEPRRAIEHTAHGSRRRPGQRR